MTDVKKEVGERLRQARERRNLKQNRVAKSLGIHNSTLAKYESGEREADYETLNKLAALYEVSVDWITGSTTEAEIKMLVEKAGEPQSGERTSFTNKFMDEFEKLSDEAQKSLFDLIKTMPKVK